MERPQDSSSLTSALPVAQSASTAAILSGAVLTLWVPQHDLVRRPKDGLAKLWEEQGEAVETWPAEGAIVPRGLGASRGDDERVVVFRPDVIEQLRHALLAFSPPGGLYATERRRSLNKPKHLLEFVNTWGLIGDDKFTKAGRSFLGCQRVSAVREALRLFIEAAGGRGADALLAEGHLSVSVTVRRADNGFHVEAHTFGLRDVLTLVAAEWAAGPAHPCENPRCQVVVLRGRFCSDKCANVVYVQQSRRRAHARAALEKGLSERTVAQRYGLAVAEVQSQRARLKEGANVRARKRKGMRR